MCVNVNRRNGAPHSVRGAEYHVMRFLWINAQFVFFVILEQ